MCPKLRGKNATGASPIRKAGFRLIVEGYHEPQKFHVLRFCKNDRNSLLDFLKAKIQKNNYFPTIIFCKRLPANITKIQKYSKLEKLEMNKNII